MNCRDAPGVFRVVAQGFSYVEHAGLEHCILYKSARPDSAEQLVLRDDSAGVIDKILKDSEGFRRELNAPVLPPYALICGVHRK
jgi:hypothetical protein